MKIKIFKLLILIIPLITSIAFLTDGASFEVVNTDSSTNSALNLDEYVPHDPIYIASNDDFTEFPGNGSESDPYRIEGYSIIGNSSVNLIWIRDVSVHFIIQNNFLTDAHNAIYIFNALTGYITINNNIISNVNSHGIEIFFDQVFHGSNLKIIDNQINNSQLSAISVQYSDNTLIQGNIITNSDIGIFLDTSFYSVLKSNIAANCSNGISLVKSNYTSLKSNFLQNNINYGIFLSNVYFSTIYDSTVVNNSRGIYLINSNNNTIGSNELSNNREWGILMSTSSNNSFNSNNVMFNINQAWDLDGLLNNFTNNYWSDWTSPDINNDGIVDEFYYFDGNRDTMPSTTMFVKDIIIPNLSSPIDVSYKYNTISNNITWNIGDMNPGEYYVLLNGSEYVSTNTWSNGSIMVPIDGLGIGFHNLTIIVIDDYANTNSDTVIIQVYENINPEVNSPDDVYYNEGDIGNTINWNLGDTNPAYYQVTKNSSAYTEQLSWINGTVSINIDSLLVGVYSFEIIVFDTYNNSNTDSVLVVVSELIIEDITNPEINSPSDISSIEGDSVILTWVVGDSNPWLYNVTMNGNKYISSEMWSNGSISVQLDDLVEGSYEFTIYIFDSYGNMAFDTVLVTITRSTSSEVTSTEPTTTIKETKTSTSDNDNIEIMFMPIILSFLFLGIIINRKNFKTQLGK